MRTVKFKLIIKNPIHISHLQGSFAWSSDYVHAVSKEE
uniref:Macaca fascicularis brain cDNA clone: QflA-19276, similar to human epidermal growth factor receptor pathway substrate 15(EPS15), mRNA, RefSeq: NM_001981.1 n=1 Tax=Macaca fascicularis TaxID=9541 RepID=I7GLS3_MACFA|nr:unnamed protein product [Macaca fascicularis]